MVNFFSKRRRWREKLREAQRVIDRRTPQSPSPARGRRPLASGSFLQVIAGFLPQRRTRWTLSSASTRARGLDLCTFDPAPPKSATSFLWPPDSVTNKEQKAAGYSQYILYELQSPCASPNANSVLYHSETTSGTVLKDLSSHRS